MTERTITNSWRLTKKSKNMSFNYIQHQLSALPTRVQTTSCRETNQELLISNIHVHLTPPNKWKATKNIHYQWGWWTHVLRICSCHSRWFRFNEGPSGAVPLDKFISSSVALIVLEKATTFFIFPIIYSYW